MISQAKVVATTDASQDATVYSVPFSGVIRSITYLKTDYADTADFVVTVESTGQNLWTQANVTASTTVYPAAALTDSAGSAAVTYDGTNEIYSQIAVYEDRVKIVVDEGGATKTGTFLINYEY